MNRISFNNDAKCFRVWCGGKNAKQVYFSVKEYGSTELAFAAAIKYENSLPIEKKQGKKKTRLKANTTSQSGIVGVCPSQSHGKISGWRSFWTEHSNGVSRQKMKDFSFATYGNRAFDYAVNHRSMMVKYAIALRGQVC